MSLYSLCKYFYKKRVAYGLLTGIPLDVMSVLSILLRRRNTRLRLFKELNSYNEEVRDQVLVFACNIVLS